MKRKLSILIVLLLIFFGCSSKKVDCAKEIDNLIDELFKNNNELLPFKDKLEISNIEEKENYVSFDLISVDISTILSENENVFLEGDILDLLNQANERVYHIELEYIYEDNQMILIPNYDFLNAIFANSLNTYDSILEELVNETIKEN